MSTTDAAPAPARRPAPTPRAAPAAAAPAFMLGLALVAIGALCIRELIVHAGILSSEPWLANTAVWIAQLQWRDWMMGAVPAAILVGLVLLVAAVKPRRRTHVPLKSEADIWLRPTDIARLCSAAAFEDPDILTATTTVSKKQAAVTVTAAHPNSALPDDGTPRPPADPQFAALAATLEERVTGHVTRLVAELDSPLSVHVTVRPGLAHAPDQRRRVI